MIDLFEAFPGLRGLGGIWAVAADSEERLRPRLAQLGFELLELDGARVADEPSLFEALRVALALPDYVGRDWDALNDCLGDLYEGPARRIALLWRNADKSFAADAQTLLDAVRAFDVAAVAPLDAASSDERTQMELFLLGSGAGFPKLLD